MNPRILVALAMLLICAGCGPIGPMPGLAIGGDERPAPADFAAVRDHDVLQVRTLFGGWLPQVHNIWGVGVGDAVYAVGVPGASWRARLDHDPDVLLRVGDDCYRMTAAKVSDPDEIQAAFDAYVEKYGSQLEAIIGHPPTIADVSDLVRFSPR